MHAGPSLTSRSMPTALVVTDDIWVINEVKAALSVGDWHIQQIEDPRSVTARVEDSRVDVAIIDMQVGSMGGMAVVRAIRQMVDPLDRPRTVLLLDRSADTFLARRAGADASVRKPVNASELRSAVSGMLAVTPRRGDEEE